MGYYYEPSSQPDDEKPPGCLETLVIMRAVFGLLLPVVIAMVVLIADLAAIFVLFSVHPALALIPVALTVGAIWLVARWDQRRERPPGL
jgi:hypothetical protein